MESKGSLMRDLGKFIPALVLAAFLTNALWESIHLPLYTGYEHLGTGWRLILWATAGDVLYTCLIVGFVFLCSGKNPSWRLSQYTALGIGGFVCALLVEYKAMALHKWAYTTMMPTFLHVGLSPLLQLTILVPLSVYLAQSWAKR